MKKKIILITILITLLILIAIGIVFVFGFIKLNSNPVLKKSKVIHDEKFGGVYADISIEDFNKLGFTYGDSVNVSFSTGYTLNDIPYYNGYYVDSEKPLVVSYPGYEHIKIGFNYGDDLWKTANLNSTETVTITLNQKSKYLKEQEANDIHYSNEQGNKSDEKFGNFRNVKVGNMKENTLYRSASPVDNSINRAAVVDKLAKEAKIEYILDLSDSTELIDEHLSKDDFNSPYFKSLYESNNVKAISLTMQFKSKEFSDKLAAGLAEMAEHDGPYLIHCVEGKDRTGFVLVVLEAFCGASYDEIVEDYMKTYENYYGITKETNIDAYTIIKRRNVDAMLRYIGGLTNRYISDMPEEDLKSVNWSNCADRYLSIIGVNSNSKAKLKEKLMN